MIERLRSMLIKEFLQIFRNPRMRSMIFLAPLFQLLVFGFAATTDVNHVATAVYDLDNTPQSREFIRAFTRSRYFDAVYYIDNDKAQNQLINASKVNVVIRVNHGFGADILAGLSPKAQLILDGTDSNTAAVVLGYSNRIAQDYSRLEKLSLPSVQMRSRVWFNEDLKSRNFYIPGVVALLVTVTTLLLTALAIVREKEIGTIEQLIVSPIRPFEIILGKFAPFIIIAIVNIVMVAALGALVFHVPIRGNLWLLALASIAYLTTSLGIGLFISTISASQQEALMAGFMYFLPANMLSGFIFPIANMPAVIQYLTYLNPLRYYLVIIRGVFLKNSGFVVLWPQVLALFVLGAAVLIVSIFRFNKNRN